MEILYSDLEDEVRDGFYVDSLMKCCWMAQLQVLEEIDKVCRKHNIQYQAEWGTLLGTVRHGGFIPWDDDMDVSMKREDYNKFLKVAAKELPEGYYIMNYRNDEEYWDVMTRVVNYKQTRFSHDFLDKNCNFLFSVGMDIFPLDYVPANKEEVDLLREIVDYVKSTADVYGLGGFQEEELEERLKTIEEICNMKVDREGDLREHLYDIVVSLYSLYKEEESKEVAIMPIWLEKGSCIYPKEYYSKTARLPFDRITIPVPIAYDSILKKKYGDYMKMVRKGGSHDYPYYKEQIEIMEGKGVSIPHFEYKKRVSRKLKENISQKVDLGADNLLILEKAHLSLYKMLAMKEMEKAGEILISCQECAVKIGEYVEKRAADCETAVKSLEEYCELIYQIYELMLAGEELHPEGVYQILKEQYENINIEFRKEYAPKKKVVFITDKASRWNSLESIWRTAKEDKNCDVSVVVVPYVYKRIDGSIIEEHYEKNLFPEYVEIEDYRTFPLEKYHPDVIYINNPYDEYNYLSTVHPHFYSSNLVNFCEKLVYIPWFVITELTREDKRGWQSMQHFVTMPGVVNADQVIVQSEQVKQNYVDYLTDWAGEDTRALWEEKICGYGSTLMDLKDDSEKIEKDLPENWKMYLYKENEERKKVILYYISSASFIDYKEKAVDKLKRVLEIFKENKEEICLLWYWDVTMEETLKKEYPEFWKEFKNIAEQYKKEAWGIYDEHPNKELMVRLCDAYYGDGSAVSQMMVMEEKPVMLQNFEC